MIYKKGKKIIEIQKNKDKRTNTSKDCLIKKK